ncbi:hypothetical protein RHMOL_Rhmol03G0178900 [Rhododendron molle]|uniref:Uncharacterized protein n=1 Tax=Rhododendron molle TaxID=49168 RepID=A0ACC0PH98_RHOML|nr:hypothetical protein RHMOL_Rhmol03G0178900 [Rhododendron molle]
MKLQYFPVVASVFFLLPVLPLIASDLNSDRQALLDFASLVPHTRNLNWTYNNSICTSWLGITCNDNGTRVVSVHLPGFGLFGAIPFNTIGKLDALGVLSLRSNHLNGNLPPDIPSIPTLQSIYLQHNNFSGEIPNFLSSQLSVLEFSFNSFSGNIPTSLTNSPRLKRLNLSYNTLIGPILYSLRKFPISSFVGNSYLCGPPLPYCSTITLSPSPSPSTMDISYPPEVLGEQNSGSDTKLKPVGIMSVAIGGSSILTLSIMVFFFCCLKKKDSESSGSFLKGKAEHEEKNELIFLPGRSYMIHMDDLLQASVEVLEKGNYGTTYKVWLYEETVVVVKRLGEIGAGKTEFEEQMESIRRLRQHPNVVPLRAYYFAKNEKLLVFDYATGGSLSGNNGLRRTVMDWTSWLKIALGTAKGVTHIHSQGGRNFTHGNINSTNVLLSPFQESCVSDFGLTPLSIALSTTPCAPGYLTPEVIKTQKVTQKSDVYSYGVLLIEMLTGWDPLNSSG